MRRAELLTLANLTIPVFNSWVRRGCLPFATTPGRKWGRYAARDVVALDLAITLQRLGAPQRLAGSAVREHATDLFALLGVEGRSTQFGFVLFKHLAEDGEDSTGLTRIPFCCAFQDLEKAATIYPKGLAWPERLGFQHVSMGDRLDALIARAQLTDNPKGTVAALEQVFG